MTSLVWEEFHNRSLAQRRPDSHLNMYRHQLGRQGFVRPSDMKTVYLCDICAEAVKLTRNELTGKPLSSNEV